MKGGSDPGLQPAAPDFAALIAPAPAKGTRKAGTSAGTERVPNTVPAQ